MTLRDRLNAAIKHVRDRRTRLRRRLEAIFNREVFSTLLVLSPLWKATELAVFGRWGQAARFFALACCGLLAAVYWHRLAAAAEQAADAAEEATEE